MAANDRLRWVRAALSYIGDCFAIDVRSLAATRILVGGVLAWDVLDRGRFLVEHYTDAGVLLRTEAMPLLAPEQFSLLFGSGQAWFVGVLFAVEMLFALALMLGVHARLAALLCLLLQLSVRNRNPALFHTSDQYLGILLLWLTVLPSDAAFALRRRDGRHAPPPDARVLSFASAGLLLQVVSVYAISSFHKNVEFWLVNGNMMSFVLQLDVYTTEVGVWLRKYPSVVRAMSRSAFLLETIGPFVALLAGRAPRIRTATVLAMIGFHIGTAMAMWVGEFPFVSIAGWLAFLPADVWRRWPILFPQEARRNPTLGARLTGLAGLSLLFVLLYQDAVEVLWPRLPPAEIERHFAKLTGFQQNWYMFAGPGTNDGWPVVVGSFADGSKLDLFRGKPATFERPTAIARVYPNDRWRTYFFRINDTYAGDHRAQYSRYLCQLWNGPDGTPNNRLLMVELIYVKVATRVEGTLAVGEMPEERIPRYVRRC